MIFDSYKINAQHRGKLPKSQKSQWVINEWDELRLFALAKMSGWISAKKLAFWSINFHENDIQKIGEDADGDLFLAKYVVDQQNQWHGYPVSPHHFDVPPTEILKRWTDAGIMTRAKANKILKGKI